MSQHQSAAIEMPNFGEGKLGDKLRQAWEFRRVNPLPPLICKLCNQETSEMHSYDPGSAYATTLLACRDCARKRDRERRWQLICPPLYRDSDPAHAVFKNSPISEALGWDFPEDRGLLFSGRSGRGKTRAGFLVLKRQFAAGAHCVYVNGVSLARASADAFSDDDEKQSKANSILTSCEKARLLFLDDLGKAKLTERAELDLYHILEFRSSHLLPMLVTTNASEEALAGKLSADRAQPIIRRLTEFCKVLEF